MGTGNIFTEVAASQHWHPGARGCSGMLLFCLLVASAITDLRDRRILNSLVYPAIISGLLLNSVQSFFQLIGSGRYIELGELFLGGIGLPQAFIGGIFCFSVICLQFLVAGTGGGDVKLQAAVGVFLGWRAGLEVWMLTMLLAGAFAFVLLAVHIGRRNMELVLLKASGTPVLLHSELQSALRNSLQHRLPLGPFFLAAFVFVLLCPPLSGGLSCVDMLLHML